MFFKHYEVIGHVMGIGRSSGGEGDRLVNKFWTEGGGKVVVRDDGRLWCLDVRGD